MELSALLMSVLGAVTSLLFSYLPGLSEWFDTLAVKQKRLVNAGVLLVVAVAFVALACAGLAEQFNIPVTCTQAGVIEVLKALFFAYVGNSVAYTASRKV